jgi:hypothetical protein
VKFGDYIKKGIEVAQLKKEAVQILAADKEAFGPALGILAIGGVCGAIGALSLWGIILMPILRVAGMFIVVAIMHFVATSFMGAKGGQFSGLFVPLSCASVLTWIGIIPFIGPVLMFLVGLWLLVVAVIVVEHVYQIDRTKAIIVVAVPVAIGILISIIAFFLGMSTLALMGR